MKRKSIVATKHKQRQREKKSQIIIGVVIAAIMIFSIFGLTLGSGAGTTGQTITEQGYKFSIAEVSGQQVWQTKINDEPQNFLYLPSQVQYINVNVDRSVLDSPSVILGFNPEQENLDVIDFARFVFSADLETKDQLWGVAITNTSVNYPSLPLVNCQVPTVVFVYGNQTEISQEESCIWVQASTPSRMVEVLERLRYAFYGVLP